MAKHIKILGQCKLPFDKILQIVTDKSTKIDASYDTERLSNRCQLRDHLLVCLEYDQNVSCILSIDIFVPHIFQCVLINHI